MEVLEERKGERLRVVLAQNVEELASILRGIRTGAQAPGGELTDTLLGGPSLLPAKLKTTRTLLQTR